MENQDERFARYKSMLFVWEEYDQLNNQDYANIVFSTVGCLLKATDSLHIENVPLPSWKRWVEPTIFKLCFQASSLLRLYQGTELPFEREGKNIVAFDEPTANTLFRSLLENYLTNFYLFIDHVPDVEKEFRLNVWKFSGFKQRAGFEVEGDEAIEKQKAELMTVQSIEKSLKDDPHFLALKGEEKKQILKGIKPRLFNSWPKLIERSNLRKSWYKNMYGFHSNYSHSEFISILQFQDGQFGHHEANTKGKHLLLIIHALIGKTIVDLTTAYPTISNFLLRLEPTLRFRIEYLSELSSNGSTEYHPD